MAPPDGTNLTTVRVSATLAQLVRAPPASVSISMVSAHALKRSREPSPDPTEEPERKRQRVDARPPYKGCRPLFPVVIRLANKRRLKITALYDTGAESFCLSSRFCSKFL